MWLDIRGPKPSRVRAALDPLGVEQLADDTQQGAHAAENAPPITQRTVPDVTAHLLVQAEVYLPSAYTGVIVAARDTSAGTTLCHVLHADGMIEQSLAYRLGIGDGPTNQALSLRATNDLPRLCLPHDQQGSGEPACHLLAPRRARAADARPGVERGQGVAVPVRGTGGAASTIVQLDR